MQDLKQKLDEKRKKVADLRKLISELKQHEEDLRILERAYEIVSGKTAQEPTTVIASATVTADSRLHRVPEISNPDAVEQILKSAGRPLHVSSIHHEIQKRYGKDTSKQSVVAAIIRHIQRNERFYRTDSPNTFGLLEWKKDQQET